MTRLAVFAVTFALFATGCSGGKNAAPHNHQRRPQPDRRQAACPGRGN